MTQQEMAGRVLEELQSDGVAEDVDVAHLLDMMAVVGVSFKEGGSEASAAFFETVVEG